MIEGAWLAMVAMFGIGLLGAGHCVGMCGGIISALSLAATQPEDLPADLSASLAADPAVNNSVDRNNKLIASQTITEARPDETKSATHLILAYSAGRIFSYACAGALVAGLGYVGAQYLALAPLLRGIAGLLLIAMGLYLVGWWRGLTLLEKAGQRLWQHLQPLAQGLLPLRTAGSAILLGLVWGWLPCGLVYTALAYAATAMSPLAGMAQMTAFGLGTLPAVLLGGLSMAKYGRVMQGKNFRRVFALSLVVYGVWTLVPVFMFYQQH